jgi:hypothetical protein
VRVARPLAVAQALVQALPLGLIDEDAVGQPIGRAA